MRAAAQVNALRQEPPESDEGSGPPAPLPRAVARVLLVDDQPANLVALEAVLAPLGTQVVTASSGEEALRHLLTDEFACALFDVRMPGLGGVELVRLLRQRERTRHLPVLLLTAADHEETDVLAAYEEGVVDYLFKPVNPTVLRAKVRTFVDLFHREKALAREELLLRERQRADALARALREKQEALAAGEAQLRRIVESGLLGLLTSDDTGRVLDANDTFLEMVGYTREELEAGLVRWDVLTAPEHMDATVQALLTLRSGGRLTPFAKEYVHKDGSRIDVLVGSSRIADQQRNMTFVLDVSARRAAERRVRFLSEASELLSSSLDSEAVLERLTHLAVPSVADWCAVDVLTDGGHVRRLGVSHTDPRKVELARELERRYPMDPAAPTGLAAVLRTGVPEYLPDVSEADLERGIPDAVLREQVRALGFRSSLCVPLIARGRVLGALSLVNAESQRRFSEDDLRLAEDLARRAATAVDNALLYQEAQEAARRAERERETAQTLSRLGLAFASERDVGRLVRLVTDKATRLVGAAFGVYVHSLPDAQGQDGVHAVSGAPPAALSDPDAVRRHPAFAHTFEGGDTVQLAEVRLDEAASEGAPSVRSFLAVPVRSRSGKVLGGLFFGHPEAGRFSEEHARLVEGLAAQAAVALDNARLFEEVQCAVRVRDEFLSVATHELKTPLTSLKLQHQLIQRTLSPDVQEAVGGRLGSAMRQVDRLTSLIESLLDVSRISAGRLTLERARMDLGQAVHDAVDRMREVFAQAGCPLDAALEEGLWGEWDALRVDQVLVNLLTNAAKYGAGRPVHVRTWREEGRAKVSVRDEGIGIAPEAQARIFDRFERAVSERHYGGLGLGLYITRQIVEALGGSIRVESAPGQGATFTVELPLARESGGGPIGA